MTSLRGAYNLSYVLTGNNNRMGHTGHIGHIASFAEPDGYPSFSPDQRGEDFS